jgi:hypothetical protein
MQSEQSKLTLLYRRVLILRNGAADGLFCGVDILRCATLFLESVGKGWRFSQSERYHEAEILSRTRQQLAANGYSSCFPIATLRPVVALHVAVVRYIS